jgi:hypothetical protein
MIAIAGGAVALLVVFGIWWMKRGGSDIPPLTSPPEVIVKFMGTKPYLGLPWETQLKYMDRNENIVDKPPGTSALAKIFKDGKVTEAEAQVSLQYAFLEKLRKKAEKWYKYTPQDQEKYLRDLIKKKGNEDTPAAGSGASAGANAPAGKKPSGLPKTDKSAARPRMEQWPTEVRERVKAFEAALKKMEKIVAKEEKEAARAAHNAAIPAGTRPAGKKP